MITRQFDAAVFSMQTCGERLPFLRDQYRPGSIERAALDDVLASLRRADAVLFSVAAEAPEERG